MPLFRVLLVGIFLTCITYKGYSLVVSTNYRFVSYPTCVTGKIVSFEIRAFFIVIYCEKKKKNNELSEENRELNDTFDKLRESYNELNKGKGLLL